MTLTLSLAVACRPVCFMWRLTFIPPAWVLLVDALFAIGATVTVTAAAAQRSPRRALSALAGLLRKEPKTPKASAPEVQVPTKSEPQPMPSAASLKHEDPFERWKADELEEAKAGDGMRSGELRKMWRTWCASSGAAARTPAPIRHSGIR
jgi:hypothetical protein